MELARRIYKQQGAKTYVPNKPCKYGHRMRYVNSGVCVDCQRKANASQRPEPKSLRIAYWPTSTPADRVALRAYLTECVTAFEASRGHPVATIL